MDAFLIESFGEAHCTKIEGTEGAQSIQESSDGKDACIHTTGTALKNLYPVLQQPIGLTGSSGRLGKRLGMSILSTTIESPRKQSDLF